MARVPPPQVQHWEPPDTGTADVRLLTGNRFSCPIPKTKTCSKISQLFSCPVEGLARYDSGAAAYSCGYRASISPLVTLAGSVVLLGIAVGLSQLAGQLSVVLCWRWALHGDDALSRVARSIASLGGLVCMIASVSVAVLAPIYSAATSDFDCQFEDMPSLALASSGADACYPYWVGTAVALAGVVAWRRTRKGAAPIDGAADPQAPSGDGEAKEASLSAPVPAASAVHEAPAPAGASLSAPVPAASAGHEAPAPAAISMAARADDDPIETTTAQRQRDARAMRRNRICQSIVRCHDGGIARSRSASAESAAR